MLEMDTLLNVVRQISNQTEVTADSAFTELGMDSTNLVEVLIELEMILDMDILDANLNFYEMEKVSHMFDYVLSIQTAQTPDSP
ncbi:MULTISPECIES: phosphopantetheine-binding protein [Paenibacillus]|uniref:phosphopantetheine-binding protein n=1 Tax=Paenibacillus TaxID=44249 RepID=UPI000378D740|nr:phosphopantetheine-binding protein [Paenibacillus massiliensis]